MFWWKKEKGEKLPEPKDIPELVGRYVAGNLHRNPDWVWHLKAVVHRKADNGKHAFDVRVFDPDQAVAESVTVKDYTSLDEHPELILYQGWFDKNTNQVQLEERIKAKE